MKIDGLFIEYLISGGVATIWIYPLGLLLGVDLTTLSFESEMILLAIPITYVIGMLVDYTASKILSGQKRKARQEAYKKIGFSEMNFYDALFEISKVNTTLVKHLELRNTRVRAARGVFTNFLLALIIIPVYTCWKEDWITLIIVSVILIVITMLTWFIFKKMIKLNYKYQSMMIEKISNDKLA